MTLRNTSTSLPTVEAWTDGACKGNPGPGGYGVYLRHGASGRIRKLAGAVPEATNNIMELQAVICALKALKTPAQITIHTDSKYIAESWGERLAGWQQNGWKTASRRPVANRELWQELLDASEPHHLQFAWVKGHADCPENTVVDELASKAALHCQRTGQTGPWTRSD